MSDESELDPGDWLLAQFDRVTADWEFHCDASRVAVSPPSVYLNGGANTEMTYGLRSIDDPEWFVELMERAGPPLAPLPVKHASAFNQLIQGIDQ